MNRKRLASFVALACLLGAGAHAGAQDSEIGFDSLDRLPAEKPGGKLSADLQRLAQDIKPQGKSKVPELRTEGSKGASPTLSDFALPLATIDGKVVIDAVAYGDPAELQAELEAMGLENAAVAGRIVSGYMPVSQLGAMASLSSLQFARPALSAANVGLTTSQGDAAQGSDVARSLYGLDGSGVTIGSLSDSYDFLGGAATDVANNDLPGGVIVLEDSGSTDEGRAMMQLIHDVAPGSSQAFHTANGGQANFANGIRELQSDAGADIIVDDIIYFAEPMFQDGIIAQAADEVVANGSAYFSSAGNNARDSYESAFRDSGVTGLFGGARHDFDPGPGVDDLQSFLIQPGETVIFSFQWKDPVFSALDPAAAPVGAQTDLDILIYQNGAFIGIAGAAFNIFPFGSGDPIEVAGLRNPFPVPVELQIGLELFAGPEPELIKFVHFGGQLLEHATNSPTSYGHANAAGAEAVGASAFFNTALFNPGVCEPACLNSFSSAGGVPILFDTNGVELSEADIRLKPGVVGPDGGNTTFFGFDINIPEVGEPDGFPNFFGTSASAPHVAALAALVKQTDPSATPGEILELIRDNAQDMVGPIPAPLPVGFDFDTGFGFVDAEASVVAAATDPRNDKKRFVCHKGRNTLSVSRNAVAAHLRHGDKFGLCE
jgi:hypothetical protein